MKKFPVFPVIVILVIICCLSACRQNKQSGQFIRTMEVDPGFATYIEEYSSGMIPVNAGLRIKLSPAIASAIELKGKSTELDNLFACEPAVDGKCTYQDGVFTFQPDEKLEEGTEYKVTFFLEKIFDVPASFAEFKFNVFTLKRNFSVTIGELRTRLDGKSDQYIIQGELLTSVPLDSTDIENTVEADQEGAELQVQWKHDAWKNSHQFTIPAIQRKESASKVTIAWNGRSLDLSEKGEKIVEVPAISNFKLLGLNVTHQPEQQVQLVFSDPIDPKQDLEGLVEIKGVVQSELSVEGNQITVFLRERLSGEFPLVIDKNIRNIQGQALLVDSEEKIDFRLLKPALSLPGRGVFIPDNGSAIFPFEAVNLKAVDLRIVQIFPSNILYFLQSANIDYPYDLKRVGKLIYSKRVDLVTSGYVNLNRWNAFSIDLSKHITIEKGAIYQIEIGMQKAYSLYTCTETPQGEKDRFYDSNKAMESEKDYWEDPEVWENGYDDYYYDWQQRENPCSRAYFSGDRNIKRNIMISNIGLTVKKGFDNEVLVACSNLLTAMPLKGVKLEIFNYQLQPIASGESDGLGFGTISFDQKPFVLVASYLDQKSYLKLNESNALSLSQFDVSGEEIQKGIKAFIYTERGVWRPGDSIYASVFVDDRYSPLPDNHPVIFKLTNTRGQVIQEQIKALDRKHLLTFRTATAPDAETGIWRLNVSIGGAEFSKLLRIETIKPNRLKINFSSNSELIRSNDRQAMGTIETSWLTGLKAPKLRTVVEFSLNAVKTQFEDFRQFNFDDGTKIFTYQTKTLVDQQTDEVGKLVFPLRFDQTSDAPGMLNADFTIRVFETGGDASIRQFSKRYSPFKQYAGLFIAPSGESDSYLKVDENTSIKIVSVNEEGQAAADKMNMMIYKLDWRWWWESSDQNIGSYVSRSNSRLITSRIIETGKTPLEVTNVFRKAESGRYLIVLQSSSGHTTSMVVYNRPEYYNDEQPADQATMLSFTSDKKQYTTGETMRISFPAPDLGRALVTIENGSKVLEQYWMETKAGNNELKIMATAGMAPCAYLHISLIQPYGQRNNDHPIRMYGVIPLAIENPDSRLYPVLQIPSEFRPEKKVSVTVSEKNGRAMSYTIAMVDEGLLDLTGFATPDPWKGIYRKEALGVKTWDLYDDVLGAFGGRLEKLFAIGGDMNPVDPSKNKASRFKPIVYFAGPFHIGKGEKGSHNIELPAYSGAVRTMVIAGNEGAYGSAEKSSAVKSPLMLLATAPRSLGFNEEITIPVSVFAQNSSIQNVSVSISCSDHFNLVSGREQKVLFSEMGEKGIEFKIKTAELSGVGTITLSAVSGGETTRYEMTIPVSSRELPISENFAKVLKPGEEYTRNIVPFGIKGSNKVQVSVSGLPSANLDSRLNYLIQYPHGCTEQTISAVFPQLYLSVIQELSVEQKFEIENNVQAAISKLKKLQNVDGSFGFWPGGAGTDEWLTNYAGHFFYEAELKGFTIPTQMKKMWMNHQLRISSEWKGNYAYQKVVQAYRLYTLALADKPVFSAMNRLREDKTMPLTARWFLAGAYAEAGRPEAAWELIDMRNIDPAEDFNRYTYGSQTRDRAMLLLCMIRLNDVNNIFDLYKRIAGQLNSEEWMNTQTVSFALIAVSKTMEKMKGDQKGLSYSFSVNGEPAKEVKTSALFSQVLSKELNKDMTCTVKNTSGGTVFVNYVTEGIPKVAQSVKIDRKLESSVRFVDSEQQVLNMTSLKQGTDLLAVVKVGNRSTEEVSDCALTFMVPSGWEIRNTRMFSQTTAVTESQFDYRDFRDDQVNTYFALKAGETKTFLFILNASYLGKYYFPNIQTEAMYDNSYLSLIPGKWVEVTK